MTFAIDPGALEAAVPNLILLPLIESAIANGVSVRPGKCAHHDPGPAGVPTSCASPSTRVPPIRSSRRSSLRLDDSFVRKTKLRLDLLYPGQHLVALSDKLEKGHEVQLAIPLVPREAVRGAA